MSDQPTTEQIRARLRRIEGQVRGISKMLEDRRSCEDLITQLMAVRSSIDTVGALVLDDHLGACLDGAADPVGSLRDSMRLWWRFAPAAGAMGADPTEAGAQSPVPEYE
ncbi:MAG: metal-sensitive transcriptional regulator [Chloroflexi bacterium]|nr:metal-sensitive transcriptional regulator [Chloroflexota bacterium]MDA1145476.1 metal-sensitive transcriptional regulator [Chloroflexota bacterium]